jgi:hypothetical protein
MLPRLGQQNKATVLDNKFLPRRPLLIRPADPLVAMLKAVARRAPKQQSDPFVIDHHDHPKRIARRTALAHIVELLGEFCEKRNLLFTLYDFDIQRVTTQRRFLRVPISGLFTKIGSSYQCYSKCHQIKTPCAVADSRTIIISIVSELRN